MKSLFIFLFLVITELLFPTQIFSSFTKSSNNPVVKIGTSLDWDNFHVYAPSLIFHDNKMWYSGSNTSKRQIGYASTTILDNWNKYTGNPIVYWNVIDKFNVGVEHPMVLKNSSNYQMWFNNVLTSPPYFYLYYSTSISETSWDEPQILNLSSLETTWDTEGRTAPSVLYDKEKNLYRMWFTARGSFAGISSWRIGYATSGDGINWTKHPQPVLQAEQVWEGLGSGAGIGNPSVILENGLYHMFYHWDKGIGHAVSTDGIDWTKDPDNPILVPGTGDDFDNGRVMDPFVLKNEQDGKYYLYYTGANKQDKWQIGLATADSLPNIISPPDEGLVLPIIFIPGLGASWNVRSMLSCDLSDKSAWEMAPYTSVYKRLIKTLTKNANLKLNEDFFVYPYDWRQPLDIQGEELKKFIDSVLSKKPSGTKVSLVGHSLGGLVIRSYLSNNKDTHKAGKALTVGSPHQGTILSYPIWEKGEIWTNDRVVKLAMRNLLSFCRIRKPKSFSEGNLPKIVFRPDWELIQLFAPSIKSLLPIFDYLRKDGNTIHVNDMTEKNDWLPFRLVPLQSLFFSTLSGGNADTIRYLDVVDPSFSEKQAGDWIDGKPQNKEYTKEGDGTVLFLSSFYPGASNLEIDGNHGQIVSSETGIKKILEFLGLPDVKVAAFEVSPEQASREILNLSIDKEYNFEIAESKRKIYKSENNLVVLYDPKGGIYRLKVFPKTLDDINLFADLISDEKDSHWNFTIKVKKVAPLEVMLILTTGRNPQMKLLQ